MDTYKLTGEELVEQAEKILYKTTPQTELYFYLLRPDDKIDKPLPAIVYFYGGGWVEGDVTAQIPTAAWFRDHGIIAITVDYRVETRHQTSPVEAVEDAKSAVRYVREHAEELGIDPERIIVGGGSAGGHLAVCTLLKGGDAPDEDQAISTYPNALVLHNPVLGSDYGLEFFEAHPEFSPILHIHGGWPPTILSNGTHDQLTSHAHAMEFTQRMKDVGNVCELITVQGADHSCDWPVSNPNFLPTLQRMTDFLIEQKLIESN